jgi:hypothetical protein
MVDHPRPGRDRHQDERAQELDDQPDPQWTRSDRVRLEAEQVVARRGALGIRGPGGISHVFSLLSGRPGRP